MSLNKEELKLLLSNFNIHSFTNFNMIDTSHGDNDIRHNYIIDNKYVLRINSANVMSEKRLDNLNVLIKRYNDFGFKAPYYILSNNKTYSIKYNNYYVYLSEYLDLEVADNIKDKCRNELLKERVIMVARFASAFKNYDLIDTLSMYSLFDLSPYDELSGLGIDEKQDNFNTLYKDLINMHEDTLASLLKNTHDEIRKGLLTIYKTLPRCVFQGDENFSNLCVDDNYHIVGLFDFNMSGTEVIANYLANIALQGHYYYTDEILDKHNANEIFDMVINSFKDNTKLIQKYYQFEELELQAYKKYAWISMISGYWNQYAFCEYLKNEKYKAKIIELLMLINSAIL